MQSEDIQTTLTRVGVYMGDHAQDVTEALKIDPDMKVSELVERVLYEPSSVFGAVQLGNEPHKPIKDAHITIRVAVEPKEHEPERTQF